MILSIIIVNYNVKYFLEQCLRSVEDAIVGIDAEIFVVDNTSSDGSDEMVRTHFPKVNYIYNQKNVGFSKANNQAIALSKGKYVLLLNPDTIVQEDTFNACLEFMERNPEAGALGIKMLDGAGKFLPESKRGLPTPWVAFTKLTGLAKLFPKSRFFGRYHLNFLSKDEIGEIDVLAGAYMFMRKEALQRAGLLDEAFFMYGEDIDLSYRIQLAGFKNYYFPNDPILHYKGESTKKGSLNYVFIFYDAMVIFAKKHFSGGALNLFVFVINIAIYLRASFSILKRAGQFVRLPLIDFVTVYTSIRLITHYWEQNHKYVRLPYPDVYLNLVVPIYILIWMLGSFLYGNYGTEKSIIRLLKGIGLGTVLIAILYAFVQESFRFSRALIVLDAIATFGVLALVRILYNYVAHGKLSISLNAYTHRVIVLGDQTSLDRIKSILGATKSENIVGFISNAQDKDALSNIDQIEVICETFGATELVFDANVLKNANILTLIEQLYGKGYVFKILPKYADFIIGSDSTETKGSMLTNISHYQLSKKEVQSSKYLLDKSIAFIVLLGFPFALFSSTWRTLLSSSIEVLKGEKTWIGFMQPSQSLPKIRTGIFNCASIYPSVLTQFNQQHQWQIQYAKDYTLHTDIKLMLKLIFNG